MSCRERRIIRELNNLEKEIEKGTTTCIRDLEYNQNDLSNVVFTLLPQKEPYCAGAFRVSIHFPTQYPFKPPKLRFLTPIYHPNINENGCISNRHSIYNEWLPVTSLQEKILQLSNMLYKIENNSVVNQQMLQEQLKNPFAFNEKVRRHIMQHASLYSVLNLSFYKKCVKNNLKHSQRLPDKSRITVQTKFRIAGGTFVETKQIRYEILPENLLNKLHERTKTRMIHELENIKKSVKNGDKNWIRNIEVDEEKPGFVYVTLSPCDGPYKNGSFKLAIYYPYGYPYIPLSIKFLTTIYHPTITENGEICKCIYPKHVWNPSLSLEKVLLLVINELVKLQTRHKCVMHTSRAHIFQTNFHEFYKNAQQFTLINSKNDSIKYSRKVLKLC